MMPPIVRPGNPPESIAQPGGPPSLRSSSGFPGVRTGQLGVGPYAGRVRARRVLVIGIGAGDPSLLTIQAVAAIAEVDAFIVVDKGEGARDLAAVRAHVLERHATRRPFREVHIADTRRRPDVPYTEAVATWHADRVAAFERSLIDDVADGECAGLLVWGDPALYDSTLRIIDQVSALGTLMLDVEVIPGISSVQLLAARHRIPLNRIGEPVQITTGRRLAEGLPIGVADVVVLLDANNSFLTVIDQPYEIFWGAYLGTPDELLISGPLADVADEIVRVRDGARQRKGWMFDIYLLRRIA